MVDDLPSLELYVSSHCRGCRKAEAVVRSCERLASLVRISVCNLDDPLTVVPPGVFGVPTLVFYGTIVGLGTPDCAELAGRIKDMAASNTTP